MPNPILKSSTGGAGSYPLQPEPKPGDAGAPLDPADLDQRDEE